MDNIFFFNLKNTATGTLLMLVLVSDFAFCWPITLSIAACSFLIASFYESVHDISSS